MSPVYFDGCFGWLHQASGKRAVVICPALGVESLILHRFVRRLAMNLADAGLPTLRFDYCRTGNSLGEDGEPGEFGAWLDSIRAAAAYMRQVVGAAEITVVAFRAGGLLAAAAAPLAGPFVRFAWVDPVISGKIYLRQQRALIAFMADAGNLVPEWAKAGRADTPPPDPDQLESAGFVYSGDAVRALGRIDLPGLPCAPAPRVGLFGRSGLERDTGMLDKLRALGAQVETRVLPGFDNFEWNPTFAVLPEDVFASLVGWLAEGAPQSSRVTPAISGDVTLDTPDFTERPARFGAAGALFGILCTPRGAAGDAIVLIANHGANHHIGWARMYTSLARRLARQGLATLRLDLSGMGDSATRSGHLVGALYENTGHSDLSAAADYVQTLGYSRICALGHCSGGHQVFHAAARDPRFCQFVAVNVKRFYWNPGDSIQDDLRTDVRASSWYYSRIFDRATLMRLLKGQVNATGIGRALLNRGLRKLAGPILRLIAPRPETGYTVVQAFRRFAARGGRALLIYSDGDSALDELSLHAGRLGRRVTRLPGVHLEMIRDADHNITARWSRDIYFALLEKEFQPMLQRRVS